MQIRLQKYLAEASVASRRKAEQLILNGDISVNGVVVRELGTKVEPRKDTVRYNGKKVLLQEKLYYIMLHKPEGCVTTVKDQFDRSSVLDYVKDIKCRLYPIGRLDYNTSGLLLLTNDGDLTYKLTHPKHNIEKVYMAKLSSTPTPEQLQQFRTGLVIDDYKTAPAKIEIVKGEGTYTTVKITINEGRNRQVRKMCEAIDHQVHHLKRVATGKLFLGDLEKGQYRHLTRAEILYLKQI